MYLAAKTYSPNEPHAHLGFNAIFGFYTYVYTHIDVGLRLQQTGRLFWEVSTRWTGVKLQYTGGPLSWGPLCPKFILGQMASCFRQVPCILANVARILAPNEIFRGSGFEGATGGS